MTGGGGVGGRYKRRRKSKAGGRATTETENLDSINDEAVNSNYGITEKSSFFPNITELPPTSTSECDFFTQARKALSFRHPFFSDDSQAPTSFVYDANTLPYGLMHYLSRYSDSRKRHKKSHSASENKSSAPGPPRELNIWIETEEYFRQLTVEDIEMLEMVAGAEFSGREKCFLIPCLEKDDSTGSRYESFNRMLACDKDILSINAKLSDDGEDAVKDMLVDEENDPKSKDVENDSKSMDVDCDDGRINELAVIVENKNHEKKPTSFSGVEWLLGSRSKIYLASERLSKKKFFLDRNSGLEKLLVASPVADLDYVCHYCSYGDMGDPLNCLIQCCSCGMVVHQRCYGVQEEVGKSWSCSWCEWKSVVGSDAERRCLLCPKQGGALKPVEKVGSGSESDGSGVEFAHLFCCQWMPEVHVENMRTMEPVMNLDVLKDTRTNMICYLCKVKCGACVRCSNRSCRTSFHPICARDAGNRMEIWGKLGSDEVELRAFCSKHSGVQLRGTGENSVYATSAGESVTHVSYQQEMVPPINESQKLKMRQKNDDEFSIHLQKNGETEKSDSPADATSAGDTDLSNLNDILLDEEDLLANRLNSKSCHIVNGGFEVINSKCHHGNEKAVDGNGKEDSVLCSTLNFSLVLKKLIDVGKVDAKNVALEIGISPDLLKNMLNGNLMAPELQCKIVKWLKNHAHIGSLQKNCKAKIKTFTAPKDGANISECASSVSDHYSCIPDIVPFKSVPPHTRTESNIRMFQDDKSCLPKEMIDNETTEGNVDKSLLGGKDLNGLSGADESQKMMIDPVQNQDHALNDSHRTGDKLSSPLAWCLSEDRQTGETKQPEQITSSSSVLINELMANSYVHPYIYIKLMQKMSKVDKLASFESAGLSDRGLSPLESSSSLGCCCNNHTMQGSCINLIPQCKGESFCQSARNIEMLKLFPQDEVEGELIYYQQRLFCNSVRRKHIYDDMILNVVKSVPWEIETAGKHKWDDVSVSQYNHELRETKKQGRKERRHKEAQAVLAAAAAAVAASSRISSFRKDILEESAHQEDLLKMNASDAKPGVYSHPSPRVKQTISRSSGVASPSLDINSDFFQLAPDVLKEHPRICDLCGRPETVLIPILVCSSCKVAVHLDCYKSSKSSTGPWHCELCEDLISTDGSGPLATNYREKPCLVAECGLCGCAAGAFRKSVDGQWIHALCAEWILELTYRRGQTNPIQGMDTVCKGVDTCLICHRTRGVCLKCSDCHCQSAFHPTCARSAGFYMTLRNNGGRLQHNAYCDKHSIEQRAKDDTQKHGIEEFKGLKQIRIELERLRLLCERIIKREKLKRELVLCSHDILASSRDSIVHVLARHPFYQPAASSESVTTSIQGYTDDYKSVGEILQRSDDVTVDSSVSGTRRLKISLSKNNYQRTANSSTSQNLDMLKHAERVSISGKQIPHRLSATSQNPSSDVEKHVQNIKHTEVFEKELVMTSDQAAMKNHRLPKGFVYVPSQQLSKDNEIVPHASS